MMILVINYGFAMISVIDALLNFLVIDQKPITYSNILISLPTNQTSPRSNNATMPSTIIFPSSQKEGTSTIKNAPTFNGGDVYLDMIHADGNVAVANVTFTPCARSYWHTRERTDPEGHFGLGMGL